MSYLPTVSWQTVINNVTVVNSTTYTLSIANINPNDPGASNESVAVGFYVMDWVGHMYTIIEINIGNDKLRIKVTDDFATGVGPQQGRLAYIYKSVGDGLSPYISPVRFERLDSSAIGYALPIIFDILYKNSGGSSTNSYLYVNVSQVAHGFITDFVYFNGTIWIKAIATDGATCATHYALRIDDDNFMAIPVGEVDIVTLLDDLGNSLVIGEYYFLSQTTAGKVVRIKPTTGIIQSVLKVNEATKISVSIQEPYDITSGSGSMTYPNSGIPISTGSAWGSSIPNNSPNWDTAYGWGNHAGLYRPISYVPADSEVTFTDITTNNVSTSKHGFFPKLPAASGKFLRDDLSWQTLSIGLDSYSALTYGATVTWDVSTGLNKTLTSTGNFTLSITNLVNGMSGDLRLNVTSVTTITLPTSKLNGSVTSLATGVYHLCFVYDGTNLEFNIAKYA